MMEPNGELRRLGGMAVVTEQDQTVELVSGEDVSPVALSFDVFFADHHHSIASALAFTLRDAELARDAAAEAMARAYQRWGDVGGYANPAGWVYRVGLNWARSRRRKLLREVFRSESPEPAATPKPEADHALNEALAELPVDQRSVVVLRYLLDWSEFQTAEALQIAPGTVKSRLSRALNRLAVVLEDSHES